MPGTLWIHSSDNNPGAGVRDTFPEGTGMRFGGGGTVCPVRGGEMFCRLGCHLISFEVTSYMEW